MPDETPTTPATPSTPAPAPPPLLPPQPQTVTIPLEQLQAFAALQARLSQVEAEQRQRDADAQRERADLLVKKGEVEAAMKLLREQSEQQLQAERTRQAQTEERAKRYALDGELSRALAAQPLASRAAVQQLATLFRPEFQVQEEGGSFAVRTPTYQSVDAFVTEKLAQPEFAHFVRAGTQGGTGGNTGGHQERPTPPAQQPAGRELTMGERAIEFMKQQKEAAAKGGDASVNMALPFGLKRTS